MPSPGRLFNAFGKHFSGLYPEDKHEMIKIESEGQETDECSRHPSILQICLLRVQDISETSTFSCDFYFLC